MKALCFLLLASMAFARTPAYITDMDRRVEFGYDILADIYMETYDLTEMEIKCVYASARPEEQWESEYWDNYYYNYPHYPILHLGRGSESGPMTIRSETRVYVVLGDPDDENVPKWAIDPWGMYAYEERFGRENTDEKDVAIYRWPTYVERYNAWWDPGVRSTVQEYKDYLKALEEGRAVQRRLYRR